MKLYKIKKKTIQILDAVNAELTRRKELQLWIQLNNPTKNDIKYLKKTGKLLDIKNTLQKLITQLDLFY